MLNPSYMVRDQNARTGGSSPLAKWSSYFSFESEGLAWSALGFPSPVEPVARGRDREGRLHAHQPRPSRGTLGALCRRRVSERRSRRLDPSVHGTALRSGERRDLRARHIRHC